VEIPTDSLPMQQTAATGQAVYGRTITTVFEDGNEREMLMNVVPLWDEEGKSRGAVGASIDLTELKKAEKALRESELRFRQAARVSHIGIFDHDHRTDTIYWSPEQREIFGFGPNEVVTLPVYLDHVYAQDREAMAAVRRAHDPAGNGLFDVEHRIVRRDGSLRWLSIRSQTFFEGEGDAHHRVRTVGAVLDITERKLMEEERQKLVEVAQNSPDFIGIATFDAKVLFVNEAGQALVGFERDRQITTTTIFDYLPTDEISRFGREVLPVVYSGKLWWGEVLLKHFRTGELIPVEMRAFPICDANGEVIAIANVSRDIRERKRAEGEILARTQQQRAIAELGLFALACKDLSPVFEKAVAAVAKTLGVEFCKVLQLLPDGKELLLRTGVGWHEGLVGRAKVKTDTASQAGYTLLCSEPVIAEDGRTETRFALPPLLLEHGVVSGISVVIPGHVKPFGVLGAHTQQRRTFTSDDANFLQSVANVLAQQIERNQSEQDLRQAEEKYRGIFDNAVLGIFQSTPDGRYLSVNQAMARMHGYTSPEEMVATVTDIEHQEYVDPSRRREFMRLLEEQGTVRDFEFEIYRKDGSRGWASLNVRAVLGEQGKLIYYEGTQEDITERKRIEEALRESEERLRLAQEAAKIGTFEHDFQTNENRWTPEMEAIYGVPPGGFPRSVEGFLDLVHEEDRPYVGRLVEQSMRDGDAEGEWRVIWPDGTVHWIAGRWRVFKDEEGRPVRALGMDFDVTERKRAEEALRRSEERYRSLVEATTQVVWTTGAAAEAVDIPIWCEFTGQSPEEARGDGWLESVHPDDREATKVAWSEALKNGNVYEREHRVRRRDGEYRFLSVRAVPVREKDGRIREWIGTCTDITERRRIEEDLRAGQEWIAQAQNAAHLGCFNWEIKNNRMAWSPEQEKIYGLAPGTFAGRYEDWRAMVLPEDREKAEASIEAQMGGGEASAEFRVLHQNTGQIRWVGAKGRVFTDRDGKPSRMIGINMDITERKQVEEALREAKERLTEEKLYLEQAIDTELGFEDIVGQSKALKSVMESVGRVASTGATVLLLGETGTGKELVARAIHRLSQRSANAFIKMNCAAIPSGLLESELFGAEKGAFTGAVSKKVGRLELADNGTLFLDEIGEISLALQPKLLRVLQDQEFERLGGTKTLKVDFRLIAATNRDLAEEVRENEFRSDLYYRLNVFPIRLPSLRERRDDIPMLVEYFVKKCARRMNKAIVSIPKKTMEALTAWDWPGNVRELENFIERSVILTNSSVLAAPLSELQRVSVERAKDETLAASERQLILNALRESRGKISGERGAAARLGLKRTTLQSKLKNLGIDPRRPPA
jgi:PAS domain S-box-containing protein